MAILKYNASPQPAASAKNVGYILREDACVKFGTINLPEIETKIDARSYAATRELEEQLMPQRGTGTPRNHHRMILTMPDETDPDAAMQLATEFIKKEFAGTRSIVAIHKSENATGLHCHVWVDARKTDGKKLDLGTKYKSLDRLYSRKYDEFYGTNYTAEFAAGRKFNAENKIPTHKNQLKILVEAQDRNDQRRTQSGKYLIEATARRIDELATLDRTRLEIASRNLQPESQRHDLQGVGSEPSKQATTPLGEHRPQQPLVKSR
jgi:hypothetical protein